MSDRSPSEEILAPAIQLASSKSTSTEKFLDLTIFLLFFWASMFAGWLLTLAYPYGFASSETGGYDALASNFHWFQPNPIDWFRTIPYGLILSWSNSFPVPSIASFWICTFIFSVGIALVYA